MNGPLGRLSDRKGLSANFVKADAALSQQFERFCYLEFNDSADNNDVAMSRNDLRALGIMEKTAQLKENHYEITLPWKSDPPRLEDNRQKAEHQLNLLKRRLARDSTTHKRYKCFMEDLIAKGHARGSRKASAKARTKPPRSSMVPSSSSRVPPSEARKGQSGLRLCGEMARNIA